MENALELISNSNVLPKEPQMKMNPTFISCTLFFNLLSEINEKCFVLRRNVRKILINLKEILRSRMISIKM